MKVRSLVDKFTLKEKRKYIAKGEIYDVLHEEERGYAVIDLEGDGVILRLSECEVVEEDINEKNKGSEINMKYLDQLAKLLEEENKKIEELMNIKEQKRKEFTKNYFKVGKRVQYTDRDGVIEGEIIGVDDNLQVAIMVDYCNGPTSKSISSFSARKLDLK